MIAHALRSARQDKSAWVPWARSMLLILFAALPVFAQQRSLEVSQYFHTSWTSQEGYFRVGISAINSVAQTSDGYVWIAGTSGLLRFDGVRFVEWRPPANASLPRRPLHRLVAMKDGSLWIAGIGLAQLKANGEFRRFQQMDGTEIEAMFGDKEGGVWAAGRGQPQSPRLCHFYHDSVECFSADSPLGSWAGALHEDADGQLLICAMSGIWRLRPGPIQKIASIPKEDYAYALERDAQGTLAFTTGEHMNMIGADGKVQPYPTDVGLARSLLKDSDGDLWVGTIGQGVIHVHGGQTDRFTTSDGLSSNSVVSLFQDQEGNVWAGTSRGLDKFTKPAVPSLTTKQGLSNDYVNSVLTNHEGVTWIGTRDGLNRLIDGLVTKSTVKLPIDRITSLFETSKGRLLVATDAQQGLVWVDGNEVRPLRGVTDQDVFQVSEDPQGDLWIATLHSGVQHLREDGSVVETFDKAKLGARNIGITFDPSRGGFWLVSAAGRLELIKDGKLVERYSAKDGLGDGIIRDPQVDKDGGVWMGTRIGLAHLMNGKISVLASKNGLPCDAVHWMRQDGDHNVWLYTECGLVEFSERELSSWISQPTHILAIMHYFDNTDGVESVAYNGWYTPQASRTSDGRIVFATTGGLSVVDPHNLNQNTSPPPVHIEEIIADEREVGGKGRVSLPVKVHSVRIAFTALSFAAPRKVLFRYKLQGFDKDWSSPVALRQATYTNLPPGNYKFQVIACNNDGVWNTTGDTLNFYLPPAFYQTIWFRCFLAAAIACTLWLFYVLRLRRATAEIRARMGQRLQERERIARALHDTLLQDFQAVILRFQIAANRLSPGDPSRTALDEGLDHADRVLAEGRDHIRDIRADTKAVDGLVDSLALYGQELSGLWPLKFAITATGKPFQIYPVVRDEMYRIGREAIGNAFKHSNGTEVAVEVSYKTDALILRIRDDGQGMEADILRGGRPGHWGINNMRERAQKIGARLSLSSLPNTGTCIELRIAIELANGSRNSWFKLKRRRVSEKPSTPTRY